MEEARAAEEISKYKKFRKVDGATYRKVNQFLRKRTYITAREWALARLCTDFRTTNGAEMTFIGKHLPQLVPFMEEAYSPQAVNQARHSFKKKVRKASATFFYGAMCGFFTTEELDDLLFEASEVARFLLEVESTTLDIDEEIDIEDRITGVMRSVGEAAKTILKTRVMAAGGDPDAAAGSRDPAAKRPVSSRMAGKQVRRLRKRSPREREHSEPDRTAEKAPGAPGVSPVGSPGVGEQMMNARGAPVPPTPLEPLSAAPQKETSPPVWNGTGLPGPAMSPLDEDKREGGQQ